ncbi:MAG TPA: L,D-transpeptidase [Marinobacter sp.]|nr:L,D-transpeptidase [Marinobacter sp.]
MVIGTSAVSHLFIDIARQRLQLFDGPGVCVADYWVSTARNGAGELDGSGCTPRGQHYIRAMIGDGRPLNSVFRGRRPTGEIYSPELALAHPERDWILSRIVWLCGRQWGVNRGPGVDTFRRFIYIHGTPDSEPMGIPLSHGCVRMRNKDLVALFARLQPGMPVLIH